jgi:hypothetical protein
MVDGVVESRDFDAVLVVVNPNSDDPSTWTECSDATGCVKSGSLSALVKGIPWSLCLENPSENLLNPCSESLSMNPWTLC